MLFCICFSLWRYKRRQKKNKKRRRENYKTNSKKESARAKSKRESAKAPIDIYLDSVKETDQNLQKKVIAEHLKNESAGGNKLSSISAPKTVNEDLVRSYLKDIEKVPILSNEQEIKLFR